VLSSPSQGTTGCSRLDVKTQGCKTPEIEVRDDVPFGMLMYWSSVGPMLSVRQLRSHRNNLICQALENGFIKSNLFPESCCKVHVVSQSTVIKIHTHPNRLNTNCGRCHWHHCTRRCCNWRTRPPLKLCVECCRMSSTSFRRTPELESMARSWSTTPSIT
jgi:hypothetical protein